MAVFVLNRWEIALVLYIVIIMVLLITKPAMMFSADNMPKQWGSQTTEKTSVFSPMIVFPLLAIICYYLGVWIELVFDN